LTTAPAPMRRIGRIGSPRRKPWIAQVRTEDQALNADADEHQVAAEIHG
jgi:hypothetical protein